MEAKNRDNGKKLRILYLYQYLLTHTDPEHPLSTVELRRIMEEEYNMPASKNTTTDDLILLRQSDLPIDFYKTTQNKYYYNGNLFEISELKILIDALSAAKFITEDRCENLIGKVLKLTTEENAKEMRRHIYTDGLVRSDSRAGYYSVDVINTAIEKGRKISFQYTDFDVNKQRYLTNDGEFYTLSPYDLTWDGNYYYVRGYCDQRCAMRNFRLDRLADQPVLLDEAAVPRPAEYNVADYQKAVFRMFDTDQPQQVTLLCDVKAMKAIIDNFGLDVETTPIDEDTFEARVSVCTSPTFYRWVFGFGGGIRILGPEDVVEKYREMARRALE